MTVIFSPLSTLEETKYENILFKPSTLSCSYYNG